MKRYLFLICATVILGTLIYLSSIYLVEAELSLQQLAQKKETLENQFPFEIDVVEEEVTAAPPLPVKPAKSKPLPEKTIKPEVPSGAIRIIPQPKKKEEQKSAGPILISMDFENAKLKDALKVFCQQSGLNFVAGDNVKLKPITLYLNNVTVSDALDAIITANGLVYERAEGSDIFIVKESGEPEINLETRIFKLQYAFAEDRTFMQIEGECPKEIKGIKEIITKLLTPHGNLTIDERTNSLIITDIPSRFELIAKSIADLDMLLPQIVIEAKIVELTTTDIDQLGIRWNSLAGYTIGVYSPTRTYTSTRQGGQNKTDQYSITTNDENTDKKEWQWDGNRYNLTQNDDDTEIVDIDSVINQRAMTDIYTRLLSKVDLRSAILSADNFEVTLSLLLTDRNVDIISCPNIVTEHAKEAKIIIGQEYPIPKFNFNEDTASWEIDGFEYKDIGVLLRVIPYASTKENNITLEVRPEISSVSDFLQFGSAFLPIIATRKAITKVAIKHGETLAIGGLLQNRDNTQIVKIPVLGDIPILGRLFKHKESTKVKTNTIIFVTPRILENRSATAAPRTEVSIPKAMPVPVPPVPTAPATPAKQAKQIKIPPPPPPEQTTTTTTTTTKPKTDKYNFSHR